MHQHPPSSQEPSWPSSTMIPTEYDAMFQNFANHVSRSELLRRLSNHSSSPSGNGKRGSARITKQTSTSGSPNHVQRRRTTANHATRSYPRASQENSYEARDQRLRDYYSSRQLEPSPRPMSWHPGSDTFVSPGAQSTSNIPALGNTITSFENLAVSNTPDHSVQQRIQNAFAMAYNQSTSTPVSAYEPSTTDVPNYEMLGASQDPSYDSYPTHSNSDQLRYSYLPQSQTYNVYPPTAFQPPLQWSQDSSYYPINSQIPMVAPPNQPILPSANSTRKSKGTSAPQLSRRKSKELIGMGLYDDRQSNFVSGVDFASDGNTGQESTGKGLKLEETWQPPNEDEEDLDDEGYSSEEVEEIEETPPLNTASAADAQTAVYPAYADMSNQSFFFTEDDDYMNENHFANYLAYGQPLPGVQAKAPLNPTVENCLWL